VPRSRRSARTRGLCWTASAGLFSASLLGLYLWVGWWWWAAFHAVMVGIQAYFFRYWWRLDTTEYVWFVTLEGPYR